MISRNSLIVLLCLGTAIGAGASEKETCAERLARLYPTLVEYCGANGKMPQDLYDLYREAYVEDPKSLFCVDSLVGRQLVTERLERATTFSVLSKKLEGDLLCCDEPRAGKLHVLKAGGQVEMRNVKLQEHYGNPSGRPLNFEVPDSYLDRPLAMLGLYLREFAGSRGPAIEVAAVIPGYARTNRWSGFLPGDRVINVGGMKAGTLEQLDGFLASPPSSRPYVEVARPDQIVTLRPPVPLFDLGERSSPRWVARVATAILHPDGPGQLGVNLEPVRDGVKITAVAPGSAAETAGLVAGDILTAIDGFAVQTPELCRNRVRSYPAGSKVQLAIVRSGTQRTAEATLGKGDPFALDTDRFQIHLGQLNVGEGMRYAHAALPDNAVTLLYLGRGKEAARQWLDEAIRRPSPMHEILLYQLHDERAALLAELGRSSEAIADLDRAVELMGDRPSEFLVRKKARLLHELKRYDEAIVALRSLARIERNYLKQWDLVEIARVLADAGRMEEAKKAYRDLLADNQVGEAAAKALAELENR